MRIRFVKRTMYLNYKYPDTGIVSIIRPVREIFCTYRVCAKNPFKAHANASSCFIGKYFELSLHLHLNFVYASSEGSGESALHMRRLPEPSLLKNAIGTNSQVLTQLQLLNRTDKHLP